MKVTADHLAHWREHGYVVVPDFLNEGELEAARQDLAQYYPSDEEYRATPERYPKPGGVRELPFIGVSLDNIATHPELVSFAERAIGTPELLITQAAVAAKYCGVGDHEQTLHVDYEPNSLVYPRDEGEFTQTVTIIYLNDVTEDIGPTYVVSKEHTRDRPSLWPSTLTPREDFPEVYEHEFPVTARAGSALLYSMTTFHRGSAMKALTGARFTLHVVFRAKESHWMGWSAWARFAGEPGMNRFLEQATPRQRELLGFPSPTSSYWNEETLAGVSARYPGMDMTPYQSR